MGSPRTTQRKSSIARLALLVLIILLVFTIPALVFGDYFDLMFDDDRALAFVRSQGSWGGAIGVGLIMVDLIIPIPSPAIMAALGLIYGPISGGLLASIGSFSAATLGYLLCRMIGPRAASWIAGLEQIERLSAFFKRHGLWAIALSRWMPAVPEVLACLAGLTRMAFVRFAIGNFIGSAAVGFGYAYFGARGEGNPGGALAIAILLPYLALPLFYLFLSREHRTRARLKD